MDLNEIADGMFLKTGYGLSKLFYQNQILSIEMFDSVYFVWMMIFKAYTLGKMTSTNDRFRMN